MLGVFTCLPVVLWWCVEAGGEVLLHQTSRQHEQCTGQAVLCQQQVGQQGEHHAA